MLNYTLKDNLFQVPGKMLSFSWHANGGKNAKMPWQVAIDRLRKRGIPKRGWGNEPLILAV